MTNKEIFTKIFDNPTFKDAHCVSTCDGIPCTACDWWNEEYSESIKNFLEIAVDIL